MDTPTGELEGKGSAVAKDSTSPRRGAFPSPKEVLESATPFEPRSDSANETDPQYSAEKYARFEPGIGETIMTDTQANLGTPGTPPPPPSIAGTGQQAGPGATQPTTGMGTPGMPPSPTDDKATASQSGEDSTKGTPGTPPPPSGVQFASSGGKGIGGMPPAPSGPAH